MLIADLKAILEDNHPSTMSFEFRALLFQPHQQNADGHRHERAQSWNKIKHGFDLIRRDH
jgi:hypothetical protein